MEFLTAITIDKVFLAGLAACCILNANNKLFGVSLLNLVFALIITYSLGFLFSAGAQVFTLGIVLHQLLLVLSIVALRFFTSERLYVTDFIMMILPAVQIASIGMKYTATVVQGQDYMNAIYSLTAPVLYVLTIIALGFPRVFKFLINRMNKENSDGSGSSSIYLRIFNVRIRNLFGV